MQTFLQVTVRSGWILALAVVLSCFARAEDTSSTQPLSDADVRFEQNATDGDVEVVFEVTGPDDGLTQLAITSPDGRKIVDFAAPQSARYGIREFVFESPEPTDVESLKMAYPAGIYTFDGASADGTRFHGQATLGHELPPTTSFVVPTKRAQDVPIENLVIAWEPIEGATGYIVELEQAKLDLKLVVEQPAGAARFAVPNGLLIPGRKYQLGIGSISADGNVSFVETSFTTTGS